MGDRGSDTRVCTNCRVIVTLGSDGAWSHPPELIEKFSRSVCASPTAGRPAKPSEVRFGRGKDVLPDKYQVRGQMEGRDVPAGRAVVVGADGSYKYEPEARFRTSIGWGYVGTNGMYGLGAATISGVRVGCRALQGELRAIWWALFRVLPNHPVTVVSDSMDAIELIADWRAGKPTMPPGYELDRVSGRTPTLVKLYELISRNAELVSAQWVRGHSGHPLNEGADALAKIGRMWSLGRLDKSVAAGDGARAAAAALDRHDV